jgi:hypothetical protein
MLGHISCQDETYGSLPEYFELLFAKITQEIVFVLGHDPKHLRGMVILLNCNIIGVDGSLRERVNMVAICISIMSKIMTNSSDEETQAIEVV